MRIILHISHDQKMSRNLKFLLSQLRRFKPIFGAAQVYFRFFNFKFLGRAGNGFLHFLLRGKGALRIYFLRPFSGIDNEHRFEFLHFKNALADKSRSRNALIVLKAENAAKVRRGKAGMVSHYADFPVGQGNYKMLQPARKEKAVRGMHFKAE